MANYQHIQIRRDTTTGWEQNDPVLWLGEIGADTNLHCFKVGDGFKKWSELDWYGGGDIGEVIEVINSLTSDSTTSALSAAQGKELKRQLDNVANGGVTVVDNLESSSATSALSANQGRVLQSHIDTLSDKVDDFKNVEVVNSLNSDSTTAALSAAQGKELQRQINNLPTGGGGSSVPVIDNLESTNANAALSANQGRVLNEKVKSLGIFGMGYEVQEYNQYSKPVKIKFEDGVICVLTWIGTVLQTITAYENDTAFNNSIPMEQMKMTYIGGTISGRTVTRYES